MPSKKKHPKRNQQKSSHSTSSPPLPSDHNFPSLPSSTATPEAVEDRDSDSNNTSLTSSPIIQHSAPTALPNHNNDQSFAEKAKQPPIDQIVRNDGVLDPPLSYTPTLHDPKENHNPQSPNSKPKIPSDGVRVLKLSSTYENKNPEQVQELNEENATGKKDSDQKPPQSNTQKKKKKKKAHVDTDHEVSSSIQKDSKTNQKEASREPKPEQESSSNPTDGTISTQPNRQADHSPIGDADRSSSGGVDRNDDSQGSHSTHPQDDQKKTSERDLQQHPHDSNSSENSQSAENRSAEDNKSKTSDSRQSAHSSTEQHSKHDEQSTASESHVRPGVTGSSTGDTPKLSPSSQSETPSSIPELSDREPDTRGPHKGNAQKSSTSEHHAPDEKTERFQHAERSWRQLSETAHRKVKADDKPKSRSNTASDSKPSLVWMYLSYFDRDGDGIFDPNDSFSTIRQLGFNPISAGLITFWVHIFMWPFFGVGRGRFMIPMEVAGFSGLDSKKENSPFFEDHGKSNSRFNHSDELVSPLRVFSHLSDLKDPIRFMKVVIGWMVVMSLTWRLNLCVRKEEIDGVYNGNLFDLLSHQQTV